jgi:hypothetical protein
MRRTLLALALLAAAGTARADSALHPRPGAMHAPITAKNLKTFINYYIPRESKKFYLFAQCFSGGFGAVGPFNDDPNVAVAAASGPNQEAIYDGYHEEAIQTLKPEPGRTAEDVHEAGMQGRLPDEGSKEDSNTGGGMPLSMFSLEPTTANGPVRSRHVIFWAGKPENHTRFNVETNEPLLDANGQKQKVGDVQDREQVRANFAGQLNTTVYTVGDEPGAAGWDFPADIRGLEQALQRVQQDIQATGNPAETEQFIFVASDHGLLLSLNPELPATCAPASQCALGTVPGLTTEQVAGVRFDPMAVPGFQLFMPADGQNLPIVRNPDGSHVPFYGPGSAVLEVTPAGGTPLVLDGFVEQLGGFGDDILGNQPGDGVSFFFRVDRGLFLRDLTNAPLTLRLTNNSSLPMTFGEIGQTTGPISNRPGRCDSFDDCRWDLGAALPTLDDATGRKGARLGERLGGFLERFDGTVDKFKGAKGRKLARLENRADGFLEMIERGARRGDRKGTLGVPLLPITNSANRLQVIIKTGEKSDTGSTSSTTTSTTSTTSTSVPGGGILGRALVGASYEGGTGICLERVTGGCVFGAHVPFCAGVHLHQTITIAGLSGTFPDPNPTGCGHGLVADVAGCGPDTVPPCP